MENQSVLSSPDRVPGGSEIGPPRVELLSNILPDDPLLMMGAGPVPIPAAVASANSLVINHLGEVMATIIAQVKDMARYVFQTRSNWVLGVAGPGSAAMEMAICNLVWPGTRVLSICNGFFSGRMAEMSRRAGGDVVTMDEIASALDVPRPARRAARRAPPQVAHARAGRDVEHHVQQRRETHRPAGEGARLLS